MDKHALLCLINRERSRVGARPLRANRCLARATWAADFGVHSGGPGRCG